MTKKKNALAKKEAAAVSPFQTIKDTIEDRKGELANALGNALPLPYFLRIAYTSIQKNPKLLECKPGSLFVSLLDAAQYGLTVNSISNEGHLVPFRNNKKDCWEAQFIPGYMGIIKMADNSGDFDPPRVHAVYSKDEFDYGLGLDPYLTHKPSSEVDRGEFVAAYAVVSRKGGNKVFEVVTKEAALEHGYRYSKSKSKGKLYGPWADNLESMAMKTALRKVLKYVPKTPKSEKLAELLARDEKAESFDSAPVIDLEPPKPIKEAAEDAKGPEPEQDGETVPEWLFDTDAKDEPPPGAVD